MAQPESARHTAEPAAKNPFAGLALKIGVYLFLAYFGLPAFAWVLFPYGGYFAAATLSSFGAAAVANSITLRIWERGRLSDIGLNWGGASRRNLAIGFGGGAAAGLFVTLGPILCGFAVLTPDPANPLNWGSMIFVSIMLLFGAFGEELLFHGYAFQTLLKSFGAFSALLPISVLFAAAHWSNLNTSPLSLFNTFIWGLLLGFAFLRAGDLWLPIGVHFGWNWILPLFGVNLSGFTMGLTGYRLEWRIGELWSGGEYGPEAGLLSVIVVPLLAYALWKAPIETQRPFLLRGTDDGESAP